MSEIDQQEIKKNQKNQKRTLNFDHIEIPPARPPSPPAISTRPIPGTEAEFGESIKDIAYEVMSFPMISAKRTPFKEDLRQNKVIGSYINTQINSNLLHATNQHVKFGVVYSYLYYKNFMSL